MSFADSGSALHYIKLDQAQIKLVIDGYFSRQLDFHSMPNEQNHYLTYWGASPRADLRYGKNTLSIVYQGHKTETVFLTLGKKTKSIRFNIQAKPAQFDQQYIQQHSGKVTADIPEVYELSNIVLALADKFHQADYGIHSEGTYYQAMLKWFSPFKDHPLFKTIKGGDYYSLVENGPAYVFEYDKIKPSTIYNGFRADDAIQEHLAQLESFAKTSHFRAFYQQQQAYYVDLTTEFMRDTKPQNIWRWLESEFSGRYQSYQVYFSPLGAGRHSARMYTDNNFKQAIMFISGANRYANNDEPKSIQALKLTRTLFTEIDHAYVNPVSDIYIEDINQALPDLSSWYKGGSYNNPYSTFNEYMTWSVFLLYARDKYSASEYLTIKVYVEDFMQQKRGFYKFSAFHRALANLYEKRASDQTIEDLYAPIIRWVERN